VEGGGIDGGGVTRLLRKPMPMLIGSGKAGSRGGGAGVDGVGAPGELSCSWGGFEGGSAGESRDGSGASSSP